jgi:hypothetical protein
MPGTFLKVDGLSALPAGVGAIEFIGEDLRLGSALSATTDE